VVEDRAGLGAGVCGMLCHTLETTASCTLSSHTPDSDRSASVTCPKTPRSSYLLGYTAQASESPHRLCLKVVVVRCDQVPLVPSLLQRSTCLHCSETVTCRSPAPQFLRHSF